MEKLDISFPNKNCATEFFFGRGILDKDLLSEICGDRGNRLVVIADAALRKKADWVASTLHAHVIVLPSGEKTKTLDFAVQTAQKLFETGCSRDTTLIALGGGVVLDLAGFIASTYMRGLDLILIPTTLLAMADASIGGKTAIDTSFGKNLIGTIYFPRAVAIDPDILNTLPRCEWMNGLAEILKIGLVQDAAIFDLARQENSCGDLLIWKAVHAKIEIVRKDPEERSCRRLLNFGHTAGHALERGTDFQLSHGEAVAIGCCVEGYLSMQMGYLSESEFDCLQTAFHSFSLQLPQTYNRKKTTAAIHWDKKKRDGYIRSVLIDRIGHGMEFDGQYCRIVSQKEWEKAFDWMERIYG